MLYTYEYVVVGQKRKHTTIWYINIDVKLLKSNLLHVKLIARKKIDGENFSMYIKERPIDNHLFSYSKIDDWFPNIIFFYINEFYF